MYCLVAKELGHCETLSGARGVWCLVQSVDNVDTCQDVSSHDALFGSFSIMMGVLCVLFMCYATIERDCEIGKVAG